MCLARPSRSQHTFQGTQYINRENGELGKIPCHLYPTMDGRLYTFGNSHQMVFLDPLFGNQMQYLEQGTLPFRGPACMPSDRSLYRLR
jgi:hypothetical protein